MEEYTFTWETLNRSYYNMAVECNDLGNIMYQRGNISDSNFMRKIHDRMELLHYKASILLLFVKAIKAAETENADLGDDIRDAVSCHYTIFISDLDFDIENCYSHYFADTKCYDLFCRWQKLCGHYKEYFTKTLDLPKGVDLSPYYLALESAE